MSKTKFEIISVIRNTLENGEGDVRATFTVKYRVQTNKMQAMSMDSEEVLFATDELDAYQKAKQIIREKRRT